MYGLLYIHIFYQKEIFFGGNRRQITGYLQYRFLHHIKDK